MRYLSFTILCAWTLTSATADRSIALSKEDKTSDISDPNDPVSYVCHDNGFSINTRKNHSDANRARDGQWTTTCENQVMELDCGRGNVLTIIDAEYGRFDTTTCHSYPMFFMRCAASDTYHKIHQRCDNKQTCRISANISEFGDPCPGIIKYLRVKHKCEPIPEDHLISRTVCEKDASIISCPEGSAIQIVNAFYGRTDASICPHRNILTTNCRAEHALEIVSARCDHKRNCTLSAANLNFSNPCSGTYKYLQLDYQCVIDDLKFALACQNAEMVLECTNTSFINVVRAEYGRTHPFICNKSSRKLDPAGCSSPNELAVVFGKCQGRDKCTIPANSQVFGEPCGGMLKYLEVDFFCTERFEETDSGGPPQITTVESDRVMIFSNRLNSTTSRNYIAQIKSANDDNWYTVMDAEEEKFDFNEPHTIGGLFSGELYDTRIIRKRNIVSSCLPFTRFRAWNN